MLNRDSCCQYIYVMVALLILSYSANPLSLLSAAAVLHLHT